MNDALEVTTTCPCGKQLALEEYNGVTFYVHADDKSDCPIFGSIGTSLSDVFAQEFLGAKDKNVRRAMFLSSRAVRLKLYEIIATHSTDQLARDFRQMYAYVKGSLLRTYILREAVKVFGSVFQINWNIVNQEAIFNVQQTIDKLPHLTMKTIDSRASLKTALDAEIEEAARLQTKRTMGKNTP